MPKGATLDLLCTDGSGALRTAAATRAVTYKSIAAGYGGLVTDRFRSLTGNEAHCLAGHRLATVKQPCGSERVQRGGSNRKRTQNLNWHTDTSGLSTKTK